MRIILALTLLCLPSLAHAQPKWITTAYFCPTPKLSLAVGEPRNAETCDMILEAVKFNVIGSASDSIGRKFIKIELGDGRIGFVSEYEMQPGRVLDEDPKVTAERGRRAARAAEEKRKQREVALEKERLQRVATAAAECERRGPPKIGVTPTQATESCWREPKRIVKKPTAAGASEDYVYGIGHILRFENGLLSEIIETR